MTKRQKLSMRLEGKVKKIIEDAKIKEKDRAVSGILKTIESKRKSLAKAQGKKFNHRSQLFKRDCTDTRIKLYQMS